ncbi:MAG: heavy-metal-associated domain-containing protein [Candidatus Aenigmarchaeota archaeon]|nr:heavy-metal-associated domain-containing protein [Candidatus Aenigmarchaeota archaeon]
MKTIELKIKGIHCPGCEMLINDILDDAGVEKSAVDIKKETATIDFDESKVTIDQIKKAIEDEGYTIE